MLLTANIIIPITVEDGYTVKQNATFHFTNILSSTDINSTVLFFSIYLNNSLYRTLDSLTLQLEDNGVFTSYFNLSSGNAMDTILFNTPNPAQAFDRLNVTSSILYMNEAPVGEYQAVLIATIRGRAENGMLPLENTDNATITITVSQGMLSRLEFYTMLFTPRLCNCRFTTNIRIWNHWSWSCTSSHHHHFDCCCLCCCNIQSWETKKGISNRYYVC